MRIIDKVHKKIKELVHHKWFDEIMWLSIIMFMGLGMFSLGILYERKKYDNNNPITIEYDQEAIDLWEEYQNIKSANQEFFASKNGSVVYPVGCTKGNKIKEENKVFFENVQQAIVQGYREVEGC